MVQCVALLSCCSAYIPSSVSSCLEQGVYISPDVKLINSLDLRLKWLKNKLCTIHLLHIGKLNNPSSGKERLLRHKYKQNNLIFVGNKSKGKKTTTYQTILQAVLYVFCTLFEVRCCIIFIFYSFTLLLFFVLWADNWQLLVAVVIWAHNGPSLGSWMVLRHQLERVTLQSAGIKQFSLHWRWWQVLHMRLLESLWPCSGDSAEILCSSPGQCLKIWFIIYYLINFPQKYTHSKWCKKKKKEEEEEKKKAEPQTSAMSVRLQTEGVQTTLS